MPEKHGSMTATRNGWQRDGVTAKKMLTSVPQQDVAWKIFSFDLGAACTA
jgi:hypothetical protein